METFGPPRKLVANPRFAEERRDVLASLDLRIIDGPIVHLIRGFNSLPFCYTLQSCYGHFLSPGQHDERTLDALPAWPGGTVRYRIAYLLLCVENSTWGRALHDALAKIPEEAPDCIQFGSAGWIWKQYRNCLALQVEPARYQDRDEAMIEHAEALHVERCRDLFFAKLEEVLDAELRTRRPPETKGGC